MIFRKIFNIVNYLLVFIFVKIVYIRTSDTVDIKRSRNVNGCFKLKNGFAEKEGNDGLPNSVESGSMRPEGKITMKGT